uniref:Uncharacterized protein n=1 Tax=Sipha flava TaxID=143950 RepID=A0A2S2Q7Z8_9HEMI
MAHHMVRSGARTRYPYTVSVRGAVTPSAVVTRSSVRRMSNALTDYRRNMPLRRTAPYLEKTFGMLQVLPVRTRLTACASVFIYFFPTRDLTSEPLNVLPRPRHRGPFGVRAPPARGS